MTDHTSPADEAYGAALRAAESAFLAGMQADDEAYATALHQADLAYREAAHLATVYARARQNATTAAGGVYITAKHQRWLAYVAAKNAAFAAHEAARAIEVPTYALPPVTRSRAKDLQQRTTNRATAIGHDAVAIAEPSIGIGGTWRRPRRWFGRLRRNR